MSFSPFFCFFVLSYVLLSFPFLLSFLLFLTDTNTSLFYNRSLDWKTHEEPKLQDLNNDIAAERSGENKCLTLLIKKPPFPHIHIHTYTLIFSFRVHYNRSKVVGSLPALRTNSHIQSPFRGTDEPWCTIRCLSKRKYL